MKRIKILLFLFMFCVSGVSILTVFFANAEIDRYSNEKNYADDKIIITLSNEQSKKLIDYSVNDFSELSLSKVTDLTSSSKEKFKNRKGVEETDDLISIDKYNQTLCLYLAEPSYENVKRGIDILKNRNDIIAISPDYYCEKYTTTPNDSLIADQWAIDNIGLKDAWDITNGSSKVAVAVIDSGIQSTHPDLADNIDTSLCVDCRYDPIISDPTPVDYDNHGTLVAGIIGARGNNYIGVAGTAWNIKLVSLKTYNEVNHSAKLVHSAFLRAVDYAAANNIQILNYCSGWKINNLIQEDLITPAEKVISNYSGLLVCAAGNDGDDLETDAIYPMYFHMPNMIVVGASTQNNTKKSDSNYSQSKVDLFAPGVSIMTTYNNNLWDDLYSGTSLAAPFVTGVAALIKSIRPDFNPVQIRKCILNNVTPESSLSNLCVTGGRLNAYAAVQAATERQTFINDVNGDGYKDVILSGKNNYNKRVLTTLLGTSNGSFNTELSFTSTKSFYYSDISYNGDFNGDGRSDILVQFNNGGYRKILVYLGNSSGSFDEAVQLDSTRYHDSYIFPFKALVSDVNNDGKDDFIICYKNSSGKIGFLVYKGKSSSPYIIDATTNALNSNIDYFDDSPIYTGDYNGDGYNDVLVPTYNKDTEKRKITIFRGTLNGTFNEGVTLTSTRNHKPYEFPYSYQTGDYNGDSKADFLTTYSDVGIRKGLTYYGKSSSPYINDAPMNNLYTNHTYNESDYVLSGDVNGDSYDDLIVHYVNSNGKRCMRVYNGNSSGGFSYGTNTTTTNNHNEVLYPCGIYAADVNNDGKCDIIVKWKNGSGCSFYVYKGMSNSTFDSAVSSYTSTSFFLG